MKKEKYNEINHEKKMLIPKKAKIINLVIKKIFG